MTNQAHPAPRAAKLRPPSAFMVRYVFGALYFLYVTLSGPIAGGFLTMPAAELMLPLYVAGVMGLQSLHRRAPLGDRLQPALLAIDMPGLVILLANDSYTSMPAQLIVLV